MPAMNNMLSKWIPVSERSRSLALVYSGMYLGSVTGLGFSPMLINKFGWPSVFYSFGSLGSIWFLLWLKYVWNWTELFFSNDIEQRIGISTKPLKHFCFVFLLRHIALLKMTLIWVKKKRRSYWEGANQGNLLQSFHGSWFCLSPLSGLSSFPTSAIIGEHSYSWHGCPHITIRHVVQLPYGLLLLFTNK